MTPAIPADPASSARTGLSTPWSKGWTALPAIVAAIALASCQSGSSDTPEVRADGLKVVRSAGGVPGTGNQALIKGVVINNEGCLALKVPDTNEPVIPVFDVKDDRAMNLAVGDEVALGGGSTPSKQFEIPTECKTDADYYLVTLE